MTETITDKQLLALASKAALEGDDLKLYIGLLAERGIELGSFEEAS